MITTGLMSHDTRTNAIAMSINLQATARHSNSFGKIGSAVIKIRVIIFDQHLPRVFLKKWLFPSAFDHFY